MNWSGVLPAITTEFREDGSVDHEAVTGHVRWMIESGCSGVVACGSLGEGATLSFDEKVALFETCARVPAGGAPIVAGIAALGTAEAVLLAEWAARAGCAGLMVLPPYVYSSDWREMKAHVSAVIDATTLPCMLYNNPPAYRTDFLPAQIAELAGEHANLEAVKESSGDARRVTAIRHAVGEGMQILVGLDDCVVEGVAGGATGWIAGLANAFPLESVALFHAAATGNWSHADALYRWFLPLLSLDADPKFVQYIKWLQSEVGRGSPRVRAPRLPLAGADLARARGALGAAMANRPRV